MAIHKFKKNLDQQILHNILDKELRNEVGIKGVFEGLSLEEKKNLLQDKLKIKDKVEKIMGALGSNEKSAELYSKLINNVKTHSSISPIINFFVKEKQKKRLEWFFQLQLKAKGKLLSRLKKNNKKKKEEEISDEKILRKIDSLFSVKSIEMLEKSIQLELEERENKKQIIFEESKEEAQNEFKVKQLQSKELEKELKELGVKKFSEGEKIVFVENKNENSLKTPFKFTVQSNSKVDNNKEETEYDEHSTNEELEENQDDYIQKLIIAKLSGL